MRTEQENKILNEIENLVKAGVNISIGGGCSADRYDSGFARIDRGRVYLVIGTKDSLDSMVDNIVEAGTLVDKLIDIKNHDRQHPDLLRAIEARIK
jgi:hypothetical protein